MLAEFPDGSLGECSVSADERFIVTAMKRDDKSHITVTATDGSGRRSYLHVPRPNDYSSAVPSETLRVLLLIPASPAPRMWTIKRDGTENRSLYQHDNNEFLVHETFLGAQDELIVTHWPYSLRRMSLDTPPDADDC